jgi:signal transduction histidine kinase
MITIEERGELITTICQTVSVSAGLIVGHCDTLLGEAGGPLNSEQNTDIATIRRLRRRLLTLAEEIQLAAFGQMDLLTQTEELAMFLQNSVHEVGTPIGAIRGFSRVTIQEVTGSLNDEQKETLTHIHTLAQTLLSNINELIGQATADER